MGPFTNWRTNIWLLLKPSKVYTITKHQDNQNAKKVFIKVNIKITVCGTKHLVTVKGRVPLKGDYVKSKHET